MALKAARTGEHGATGVRGPTSARLRAVALLALLMMLAALAVPSGAVAATAPADCPDVEILTKQEVEALAPGTPLVGRHVWGCRRGER
jgi:hypothetical protein